MRTRTRRRSRKPSPTRTRRKRSKLSPGDAPAYLAVGKIRRPHGVKGELFVEPLTDHPGSTFVPDVELRIAGPEEREPDPDLPPLRVEGSRPYKAGYLVVFGGVTDRNAAGLLRHRILLRPAEDVRELEDDELFHFELVGMTVVTADGERVGAVVEVFDARPADLLEVRRPGGTVLIPFSRSLVTEVDREEGTITIEPPEGLLEL